MRERKRLKAALEAFELYGAEVSKPEDTRKQKMVTTRLVSRRKEWSGAIQDAVSYSTLGYSIEDDTEIPGRALPAGFHDDDDYPDSGSDQGEDEEEDQSWKKKKLVRNPFNQGLVPRPPAPT